MLVRRHKEMYEEVPTQVIRKSLIGWGLALVALAFASGCGSSNEPLQGQDKADMEKFLKNGIPANKAPGGSGSEAKPGATPSAVPTDG